MKRSAKYFALTGALLLAVSAMFASARANEGDLAVFGLSEVEVEIAEDAFIDWYAPSDPNFETQNDFIKLIFANAATKGGEAALTGGDPVLMRITVNRFDILSTLELFFCCASNEVAATFELADPVTGEVVKGPELLEFNHMGLGGVFGALASTEGRDQLSRVMSLIEAGTLVWLSPPEG